MTTQTLILPSELLSNTTTTGSTSLSYTDGSVSNTPSNVETIDFNGQRNPASSAMNLLIDELSDEFNITESELSTARVEVAKSIYSESNSLASIRMVAGLSQRDLSRLTGLTQSHISRLENGTLDPGRSTMRNICDALSIDMNTLDRVL